MKGCSEWVTCQFNLPIAEYLQHTWYAAVKEEMSCEYWNEPMSFNGGSEEWKGRYFFALSLADSEVQIGCQYYLNQEECYRPSLPSPLSSYFSEPQQGLGME
jgi:hypothetical protein